MREHCRYGGDLRQDQYYADALEEQGKPAQKESNTISDKVNGYQWRNHLMA